MSYCSFPSDYRRFDKIGTLLYTGIVKWDCEYTVGSDKKGVAKDHSLGISLDLSLADFVKSRNVAVELATNEGEIRRQLYELVIERIVPSIIDDSSEPGVLPEGRTSTKSRYSTKSEWQIIEPKIKHQTLGIRSKMAILLNIHADRPLTSMQALNASSAALASAVTDDIVFSLKQKYLGATEHSTESDIRLSNGKVADARATSRSDSTRN